VCGSARANSALSVFRPSRAFERPDDVFDAGPLQRWSRGIKQCDALVCPGYGCLRRRLHVGGAVRVNSFLRRRMDARLSGGATRALNGSRIAGALRIWLSIWMGPTPIASPPLDPKAVLGRWRNPQGHPPIRAMSSSAPSRVNCGGWTRSPRDLRGLVPRSSGGARPNADLAFRCGRPRPLGLEGRADRVAQEPAASPPCRTRHPGLPLCRHFRWHGQRDVRKGQTVALQIADELGVHLDIIPLARARSAWPERPPRQFFATPFPCSRSWRGWTGLTTGGPLGERMGSPARRPFPGTVSS